MNTWPNEFQREMYQYEHEKWNAHHYPGTRQLCVLCSNPTGRCEEDAIYDGELGPLCEDCYNIFGGDE